MRANHKRVRQAVKLLWLLALLAGVSLPVAAQKRRPTARRYTVPANTVIRVRMNDNLSSKNARVGDTFTTTVVDPVYAGGIEVVPAGSIVNGRVTMVKRAARKSKAGELMVDFTSIRTPRATSYPINGSLSSLDENVNADNEGGVKGRSAKKRNIGFIGGGAAGGALIGAIAGGGSGAAIGAGVGAGLGVAGALLSKGKEAEVKPGMEFGVILNRSVAMYASNVR
ncbi:MAG: hypothetical protein JOZ52_04455 [Acidobacteria bacterium]|nr:hypothetical protein [Acidobacteriota bacterium]